SASPCRRSQSCWAIAARRVARRASALVNGRRRAVDRLPVELRPQQAVLATGAEARVLREVAARVGRDRRELLPRVARAVLDRGLGPGGGGPDEAPERHARALAERGQRQAEARQRGLGLARVRAQARLEARVLVDRRRRVRVRRVVAQEVLREGHDGGGLGGGALPDRAVGGLLGGAHAPDAGGRRLEGELGGGGRQRR